LRRSVENKKKAQPKQIQSKRLKMKKINDRMTKGERSELGQLIRKRERVLKSQATERAALMLAEFDAQSARIYSFDDDEVWKKATQEAEEIVAESDRKIKARCKELGIPAEFAPGLDLEWYERGQNAVASRRT